MKPEQRNGLQAQLQSSQCKIVQRTDCNDCPYLSKRIVREQLDDETKLGLAAFARLALAGRGWPVDPANQLSIASGFRPVFAAIAPNMAALAERLRSGELDAAYITNLPRGQDEMALILLAFTLMVGEPFNYLSQNDGKLVMELRPAANAGPNTNATTNEFCIHTDDAAMPRDARVEFILLGGVVNPPDTLTGYASTVEALAAMPEPLIDVLRHMRFQVRFPTSFDRGDNVWSEPMAILAGAGCDTELRFPSYATRPVDPADSEACDATEALTKALNAAVQEFPINPGTMLVFNNARGAHRRGAIRNGDRLVLRTYAARSLDFLRRRTGCAGPIFPVNPFIPEREA